MNDSIRTSEDRTGPWLPSWFTHPAHLELDSGFHLRPLRAVDVDLHRVAVARSGLSRRARLGRVRQRPPADPAAAADPGHQPLWERWAAQGASFTYGVLDEAEDEMVGCVHVGPPRGGAAGGVDADVSWWLVDAHASSSLHAELPGALRAWTTRDWPFTRPRFVGVDVSWSRWAALDGPC
ncbi:N-acetyltransferase [Kineococcus sp. SYSU DK001]|uniref:N-acetyltransferase n=1 Tax=Kineococcus sp. SYSU DK001 TaxID=3383122 RepID=UPI003D7DEF06